MEIVPLECRRATIGAAVLARGLCFRAREKVRINCKTNQREIEKWLQSELGKDGKRQLGSIGTFYWVLMILEKGFCEVFFQAYLLEIFF